MLHWHSGGRFLLLFYNWHTMGSDENTSSGHVWKVLVPRAVVWVIVRKL
jgi:hypothetical protein